jgi:hypothetical protein
LVASKTFIVDEIAECTKLHFSLGKLWTTRKRTNAKREGLPVNRTHDSYYQAYGSEQANSHFD